jgi:Kef-type K+ transport system membrane component KefB
MNAIDRAVLAVCVLAGLVLVFAAYTVGAAVLYGVTVLDTVAWIVLGVCAVLSATLLYVAGERDRLRRELKDLKG